MKLLILSLSLFAVSFTSCSSTNQVEQKTTTSSKIIKQKPNWLINTNKENSICAIGSSNIINKNYKDISLVKTKANISKKIKIYIETQLNSSTTCKNQNCRKSFDTFSKHQSTNMLNNINIENQYIDNKNNIYYTRACTSKTKEKFVYNNIPKSKLEVTKTSCIQTSNHTTKSLIEQKNILIQNAKQEALSELYGELLYSKTNLENGKISSDTINQTAIGTVRTKGNPKFYNGKNFGEICSDVTSYITQKDIEKYSPTEVKLNRFCYANQSIAMKDIKQESKYKAYQEIVSQYKPSLKISGRDAEQFIHGFKISNDKFDFATTSYCFDAVGTLLPYELELNKRKISKFDENSLSSGLIAIFYEEDDHEMSKPIYKTTIDTLSLQYRKLPLNEAIKKDTPYLIKIQGYVKSNKSLKEYLELYADVYIANLFINDKKVLHLDKRKSNIKLKEGFNKIKLIVKTANRYDIKIVGNLNNFYTEKFIN